MFAGNDMKNTIFKTSTYTNLRIKSFLRIIKEQTSELNFPLYKNKNHTKHPIWELKESYLDTSL